LGRTSACSMRTRSFSGEAPTNQFLTAYTRPPSRQKDLTRSPSFLIR
jgi:hypothetical protein